MEREAARRLLDVPSSAGPDEVERAFRRLAAAAHPDRGGDPERFRQLVEARTALRRRLARDGAIPRATVRRTTAQRALRALRVRLSNGRTARVS